MALTRRALARLKSQPNTQATTASLDVDGEPSEFVVCKDAAEGSADICTTAEGTVTDIDGALQTQIRTENDQTDRSHSSHSQEESSHRDDEKENRSGSRSSKPHSNQTFIPSITTTQNDVSLQSVEGERPGGDQIQRKRTALSATQATEPIPGEVESTANIEAESEVNVASKGVEAGEGARGANSIQAPPSQPETTLRRSQRARRPTQRYAAAMGNANREKGKKETAREDVELQKVTKTQGRLKRKRGDPPKTGESSTGNDTDDTDAEEETRHVRRRAEECDLEPVWSQSQYEWMEEVLGMGSWNRFTVPRPVSDMREINEERWRALVQVAVEAKKLEE